LMRSALPILMLLSCALLGATPIAAQTCQANGCGPSGWLGTAIPNRIANCTFKAACDNHDVCYSRCESCGDLHGKPECSGTCEMKRERKTKCDADFRNQIVQANLGKSHCQAAATAYYLAVTYGGCAYFRSIRDALAVREKWQSDFEALLKWVEENPESAKQVEGQIAIERLATVEAGKDNRLTTKERRLSLVAKEPSRRSRSDKRERLLVNGIDLTDASLDANMQDVVRALDGLKVESVPVR
jgi:hypothetical protein